LTPREEKGLRLLWQAKRPLKPKLEATEAERDQVYGERRVMSI
jgi:hypothetical protein